MEILCSALHYEPSNTRKREFIDYSTDVRGPLLIVGYTRNAKQL